jgi:hypothetical protein
MRASKWQKVRLANEDWSKSYEKLHPQEPSAKTQFGPEEKERLEKICRISDEILHTYFTYGCDSSRAIANLQDKSHSQIRRDLIDAGVYKPTPEQNRRAKKGTGPYSRIRKHEMSEDRKKEWERKVNICLENLKQGTGVETTCHANGWTPAGVWFYLYRNDEYKKWKAAHPAKQANAIQYERSRLFDWRSKKYQTEEKFQDAIEQLLKDFHAVYVREKKLKDYRSRMDFELNASTYLECKTCTKSNIFMRAIGQALIAQGESKNVWIVIPDDIKVRPDQQKILEKNQILRFKEAEFREKLARKASAT